MLITLRVALKFFALNRYVEARERRTQTVFFVFYFWLLVVLFLSIGNALRKNRVKRNFVLPFGKRSAFYGGSEI